MAFSTEIDQLVAQLEVLQVDQARTNDIISGWTRDGNTHPYFDYMEANQARFEFQPSGISYLRSTHDGQKVSTTGSSTAIEWQSTHRTVWDTPSVAVSTVDGVSTEIVFIGDPEQHLYHLIGQVNFSANSSGWRSVAVNGNYGGSSLITSIPARVAAVNGDQTIVNLNFVFRVLDHPVSGDANEWISIQYAASTLTDATSITFADLYIYRLF